ncbi:MAG: DUF7309 domain-containing protein [Moorellaceae bacterium]
MSAEPAMNQWQVLYDLAQAFRKAGPWQWMSEDNLFGVKDPDTGEVGYCAVIGELKETYGLVVYPGSEGLASYALMKESQDPRDLEFISHQKALSLIFANSNELSDKDKALIKELGLNFRGKNAWPVFRSMKPWYYPWYFTTEEARFFTVVLEQALEFCLECRQKPYLLETLRGDRILVKVKAGRGWQYEWQELPPPPVVEFPVLVLSKVIRRKIERECRKAAINWETGFFPFPVPVKDKNDERPYFPVVTLWVDEVSGMILHLEMFRPGEWYKVAEGFMTAALRSGVLPATIYTSQPEVIGMLQAAVEKLGVGLKPARELKALEMAKKAIIRDLAGQKNQSNARK